MRVVAFSFLAIFYLLAYSITVREADEGYTWGVEGKAFRARINKKFPSFISVLHDAGCPADPFIGYFYGWWTSSDFPVKGRGWVGLHMPVYRLKDIKINKEGVRTIVRTEICLRDDPLLTIRSTYVFEENTPGFDMEREFIGDEGRLFGPIGLWLGGTLSEFPISNTVPPDSYFYEGKWHTKIEHSWQDLQSLKGGPVNGEYFVILYWSEVRRYLIMSINPEGFAGGIKALRFVWRDYWKEPAWGQNTGYFAYGKFKVRFRIGKGSKEDALRSARELARGKYTNWKTPYKAVKKEKESIKYISNEHYRLGIDLRKGRVVSLQVYTKEKRKWSENLLSGKNCGIYFGGPSELQRSVYPEEPYSLDLETRVLKPVEVSSSAVRFPSVLVFSPRGLPVLRVFLVFSLHKDKIFLRAEFQGLKDISLPYLGWHLDFPIGSWGRYYNSAGGYFHRRMLENYKMGIYDFQPCYRPIGGDLIAYGEEGSPLPFRSLCLQIKDGGSDVPFVVHLPNPLFDKKIAVYKIAITPCTYDWTRHNCRLFSLEKGKRYKLSAVIRIATPTPPPSQGTFRIKLPHAPDVEKALDMFHLEHCFGGPIAPAGITSFFWTLAGKYNPRFSLQAMRTTLETYLSAIADGLTTKDELGETVRRGMLPLAKLDDDKWMWKWNQTGYIFETNAQFILTALEYALLSRDQEFVKKIFPSLEEAFHFYRSLADERELITLPAPYTGLPEQGRPSTYWDGWCIGHRYALLQVYYSASAFAMAKLATLMSQKEKAAKYQNIGEKAKASLLSLYWREGDLKDNSGNKLDGGRFISWIDVNGKVRDVGFTDIPLLAYYLRLLSEEQAKKVLLWLDSDPNAYSWKDRISGESFGIPAINTIDGNKDAFLAGIWNNFQRPPGTQNGQTQFWQGGFDWFMRARLKPDDLWKRISSFSKRVMRGDLASGHGLPYTRPLPMYQGTCALSADDKPVGSDQGLGEDGILLTVGIIEGVAGLRMDEASLYFQPAIPQEMSDISLENIRCGDVVLNIKYWGYGERIREIRLNGKIVEQFIPRSILKDGDLIEVLLEN